MVELVKTQFNIVLKEKQQAALEAIISKKDVFCCLPTGYGKTAIFTVLPSVHKKVW